MRSPLALLLAVVIGLCFMLLAGCLVFGLVSLSPAPRTQPAHPAPAPQPSSCVKLFLFTMADCQPCARLKQSMQDPRVQELLASRFDLVELEINSPEAKLYHVTGAPTLVALSLSGVSVKVGYQTPEQLATWLSGVQSTENLVGQPMEGGPIGPSGVQVSTDLPVELRAKNVGGRDGLGLCVFTSIMHSARFQNERKLWDLQKDMRKEPGGGYPQKVDTMLQKYGKGAQYLQYEGRDPSILELALKTGRMPGVTYNGHDCHYRGSIAHMVNLVFLDSKEACILDNNFIGENQLVWQTRDEFIQRWTGGRSGWAVILLSPRPPAPPHN